MSESGSSPDKRVKFSILTSLFATLTAAGAFIKIPIPYVPFTLQIFFVLVAGAVLGPNFGALSQLLYLGVGLSGLPVFAYGGGPGYVLQPTFGYLVGYPIAAYVIGRLVWGNSRFERKSSPGFLRLSLCTTAGMAVIFTLGVTGLYLNLKYVVAKPISLNHALWIGFVIFVPAEVIKIALSALVAVKLNRVISA